MMGMKWQMDVKYVPARCLFGKLLEEEIKLYQYTIQDETTRQRFIYIYKEKSTHSTEHFIKQAIAYFGYKPLQIQTDNGTEFTNRFVATTDEGMQTLVTQLLEKEHISQKLIPPATPQQNGKVERSQQEDEKNLYHADMQFHTYEQANEFAEQWLARYNRRFTFAFGRNACISPNIKRQQCEQELERFIMLDLRAKKMPSLQNAIYIYAEYTKLKNIAEGQPERHQINLPNGITIPDHIRDRLIKLTAKQATA